MLPDVELPVVLPDVLLEPDVLDGVLDEAPVLEPVVPELPLVSLDVVLSALLEVVPAVLLDVLLLFVPRISVSDLPMVKVADAVFPEESLAVTWFAPLLPSGTIISAMKMPVLSVLGLGTAEPPNERVRSPPDAKPEPITVVMSPASPESGVSISIALPEAC